MADEGVYSTSKNVLEQILANEDDKLRVYATNYADRPSIERYLRAYRGNVQKAMYGLVDTVKWRIDFGADEITPSFLEDELSEGKMYISPVLGKGGHPVVVNKKSKDPPKSHDKALQLVVYTMDKAIAKMPAGVEKWIWILDMKNYSSKSSPPLSITKATMHILASHYPERLKRAYIVDAPWIFRTTYSVISPLLDPVTKDKIRFVSSSTNNNATTTSTSNSSTNSSSNKTNSGEDAAFAAGPFAEDFDQSNLEEAYGGRYRYRHDYLRDELQGGGGGSVGAGGSGSAGVGIVGAVYGTAPTPPSPSPSPSPCAPSSPPPNTLHPSPPKNGGSDSNSNSNSNSNSSSSSSSSSSKGQNKVGVGSGGGAELTENLGVIVGD